MRKLVFSLCLCGFSNGCAPKAKNRVVLYCSVDEADEAYAKPLIKKLEAQTGLKPDAGASRRLQQMGRDLAPDSRPAQRDFRAQITMGSAAA